MGLWWEELKIKCKELTIKYAVKRNYFLKKKERELRQKVQYELECIEKDEDHGVEDYLLAKNVLDEYEKKKCYAAIVRSRVQYAIEGERCTSFFLNLEKRRQEKTYITELINGKGEKVNDLVGILDTVERYYECLFKKEEVNDSCMDKVLDHVDTKLTEGDKNMCDEDMSLTDIKEAILAANCNRSPGSDGLTAEFYKSFADLLAPILRKLYEYIEKTQVVPDSLATGVLTILYKNKGSRVNLDNYRPLTLLNCDYKILAKVLANRVKKVMGGVIAETQVYSVPGRDISDTVGTIRDVIKHMGKEGGFVMSLDLNKAFDRVDHSFLLRTLGKFGFGERMIGWIRLLNGSARSRAKCNGILTDSFPLERSVRQGCPLSAALYSLSVEPLAAMIKANKLIRGIQIPDGGERVIQQYADDTTCTVIDVESVKNVMECFEVYGKASGAKLNVEKSEIMYVGIDEKVDCGFPFKKAEGNIRTLGVILGVDEKGTRDVTWTGVLNKIKHTLSYWKARKLFLRGKVVVINALVASKCIYVLSSLDMPQWVLKEFNGMVTDFLWEGKGTRIARATLISDLKDGGLKLVDLDVKRKAMRIKTVQKYLYGEIDYGWKSFFKYFLYRSGGCEESGLLMSWKKDMLEDLPEFYKEVFLAWGEFLPQIEYTCTHKDNIFNQPVFLNPKIESDGKVLYNKLFMKAGLILVKDFLYEVIPGFLRGQAILDTVWEIDDTVESKVVLKVYEKIKLCIPGEWIKVINGEGEYEDLYVLPSLYVGKGSGKQLLSKVTQKRLYKCMLKHVCVRPAGERMWRKMFIDLDVSLLWENLVLFGNKRNCENMDFMLRHNRIYTNIVLHQINRNVRRECDVCMMKPESLLHLFVECPCLTDFFNEVKLLLWRHWKREFLESFAWDRLILFGAVGKCLGVNVYLLNIVLSFVRYAIYCRRNMKHFEGKKVNVWVIFKAGLRKQMELMYNAKLEKFESMFIKGSTLVSMEEGGGGFRVNF